MHGADTISCWSSDEFIRAAQLALANDGINTIPLPSNGDILIISRDHIGNYRYVLYRVDGMYCISSYLCSQSIIASFDIADPECFDIADPECFEAIYQRIMELTDNNPFP